MLSNQITRIKQRLSKANTVVVLTGAGVSAESGIPTFRGKDGLWNNYRAEELATPQAFSRDPRLIWEWYNWRRELIASKSPNPAHYAIVKLEKRYNDFLLITQNVDGMHRLAGSRELLELHGNIWKTRCTKCHEVSDNREIPIEILPKCRSCGGLLRPHIVWFGESLDPADMERSYEILERCDVLIVVGTSAVVQPAASFAGIAKRKLGSYLIEVNIEETPNSFMFNEVLLGKASEILTQIVG